MQQTTEMDVCKKHSLKVYSLISLVLLNLENEIVVQVFDNANESYLWLLFHGENKTL